MFSFYATPELYVIHSDRDCQHGVNLIDIYARLDTLKNRLTVTLNTNHTAFVPQQITPSRRRKNKFRHNLKIQENYFPYLEDMKNDGSTFPLILDTGDPPSYIKFAFADKKPLNTFFLPLKKIIFFSVHTLDTFFLTNRLALHVFRRYRFLDYRRPWFSFVNWLKTNALSFSQTETDFHSCHYRIVCLLGTKA